MLALWMAAIFLFLAITRAWVLRIDGGWVRLNRERRDDPPKWRNLNRLRRQDFYFVSALASMACVCLLVALELLSTRTLPLRPGA